MRLTVHHKGMKTGAVDCHAEGAKSPEVARGDSVDRLWRATKESRLAFALLPGIPYSHVVAISMFGNVLLGTRRTYPRQCFRTASSALSELA